MEFQQSNIQANLVIVDCGKLADNNNSRYDNPNSQANLQRNGRMPGALNIYRGKLHMIIRTLGLYSFWYIW